MMSSHIATCPERIIRESLCQLDGLLYRSKGPNIIRFNQMAIRKLLYTNMLVSALRDLSKSGTDSATFAANNPVRSTSNLSKSEIKTYEETYF
jgi:hypothetical protein